MYVDNLPLDLLFSKLFLLLTKKYQKRSLLNSCPTCPRASCLTCSRTSRAWCPMYSRALHALVPDMPLALRAFCLTRLVSYVPRVKRTLVSQVSYMLLYLMCLAPCVFSRCSCFELYVRFCSSFLTCFRSFKSNMILYISCLVAFIPHASCSFVTLAI